MEHSEKDDSHAQVWMELAVPLFSFGGALLTVLFQVQGIPLDFRLPALGCVIASCFLSYLAWLRPKKDIVALSTPIYSFILFVVPADYTSGFLLQLLYAVSLTILLIRLKYRFGSVVPTGSTGKELAEPLRTYVEQSREAFTALSPTTGHNAALAVVRFTEGEYQKAADMSHATICHDGNPAPVVRALSILREHTALLDKDLPRPITYLTFLPEDAPLLAKPFNMAGDPDLEFYTALDNALLLLYSVAWHASEADRPHLLACQAFAKKLLVA